MARRAPKLTVVITETADWELRSSWNYNAEDRSPRQAPLATQGNAGTNNTTDSSRVVRQANTFSIAQDLRATCWVAEESNSPPMVSTHTAALPRPAWQAAVLVRTSRSSG